MYALAIIRYRRSVEEINKLTQSHRAYLDELKAKGLLIASGPFDPRNGGALLLRVPDADPIAALDKIRDDDPYIRANLVQYELLPWNVMAGKDDLDKI